MTATFVCIFRHYSKDKVLKVIFYGVILEAKSKAYVKFIYSITYFPNVSTLFVVSEKLIVSPLLSNNTSDTTCVDFPHQAVLTLRGVSVRSPS